MAALSLDFFRSSSRYGDALKFASKPSYIFFLSSDPDTHHTLTMLRHHCRPLVFHKETMEMAMCEQNVVT